MEKSVDGQRGGRDSDLDKGFVEDVYSHENGGVCDAVEDGTGSPISELPDQIVWKWTASGVYSSQSMYDVQFTSSYCTFNR